MTSISGDPQVLETTSAGDSEYRRPLFLLGVGLGGFVDGILLHQILQWHHMLSDTKGYDPNTISGIEANMLADGLFHAATWIVVVIGLLLTIRARRDHPAASPSWPLVAGWLLIGWAVFNLVEGLVDHHLLTLHHVRDDVATPLPWDLGFLAISLALLVVGSALVRRKGT